MALSSPGGPRIGRASDIEHKENKKGIEFLNMGARAPRHSRYARMTGPQPDLAAIGSGLEHWAMTLSHVVMPDLIRHPSS
jgi:hypothetical protein